MNLTTEQLQSILDGAPDGADIYCKAADCDESPYIDSEIDGECVNCIKLSDIRAELSSRQSIQAYFASDERGSIEQEQSVIERFTNLAASFREIAEQYQTTHSIERDTWIAAAEYIERLKSERNEFRDLHIAEGAMVRDQDIELQKLKQQLDALKAKVSEHNDYCNTHAENFVIDIGEHHE